MKMRIGEVAALAACAFVLAFYASAQGTYSLELVSNFGLIAYMVVAALIGVFVAFRLGRSKFTDVSLGFAVGLVFWSIGLLLYSYSYYIVDTGLPYLSLADVFYLLTYPAEILGAVGVLRLCFRSLGRRVWVVVGVSGLLLYALNFVFVVPSSIEGLTAPLDVVVTILYPTLDITVFLLFLPLFFFARGGILEKPLAFICLGAVLLALGDLFYAALSVASLYYDGHPMDLLLFFGCVSAGYGFWRQQADVESAGEH